MIAAHLGRDVIVRVAIMVWKERDAFTGSSRRKPGVGALSLRIPLCMGAA